MASPPAPIERSHQAFVYLRRFCRHAILPPTSAWIPALGYSSILLQRNILPLQSSLLVPSYCRSSTRPVASMTDISHTDALEKLKALEQESGNLDTNLAIVRISEPIFSPDDNSASTPSKRNSDVSTLDNPTPASLEADLTHYKVRPRSAHSRFTPPCANDKMAWIGTFLETPLLLRRAGHEREIPASHRGRSAARGRAQ